jgi:hypothetical protein
MRRRGAREAISLKLEVNKSSILNLGRDEAALRMGAELPTRHQGMEYPISDSEPISGYGANRTFVQVLAETNKLR